VIPVKINGQRRVFCLRSNLMKKIAVTNIFLNEIGAAVSDRYSLCSFRSKSMLSRLTVLAEKYSSTKEFVG
jgi:hypothetical protein